MKTLQTVSPNVGSQSGSLASTGDQTLASTFRRGTRTNRRTAAATSVPKKSNLTSSSGKKKMPKSVDNFAIDDVNMDMSAISEALKVNRKPNYAEFNKVYKKF